MYAIFRIGRKEAILNIRNFRLTFVSEKPKLPDMDPARSVIEKLGGEAVVAGITKTASTAPYRWQYSKAKGGTDGWIPRRHHQALLDYARENGIDLRAEEFLPAREAAE